MPAFKFTNDQVAEALRASRGIPATAARVLEEAYKKPITGRSIRNYIKRSKKLRDLVKELQEEIVDMAETGLVNNLVAGDMQAIKYVLQHWGRDRGWGAPVEINLNAKIDGPPGAPIQDKAHMQAIESMTVEERRARLEAITCGRAA